ncbi:MAG: hypothetical protein BGO26_18585 [Actinobacteria bacterium 69-20]|nr:sensor histidine kinase [Actinomycetota bacterium]OJV24973.1 MAG: hypothetical protein BGO26_18585 [Actinobacteria bacterium 69-20]
MGSVSPRQFLRRWAQRVDVALALTLGAVGQAALWTGAIDEGPLSVTAPSYAVISAAVLLRRRWPLVMAAVVAATCVAQSVLALSPTSLWALVMILIVSFSVGAHAQGKHALVGGLLLLGATYAGQWLEPGALLGDRLFTAPVLCGGPWFAGWLVRRHSSQARALDELNVELQHRRAEDVQVARRIERARIARELHDVVAHSISVMVVQAGAAGRVIDQDPQRAKEPLEQIRITGKAALVEMRRLLGVLRTDDAGLALTPQPGVADLSSLVAQIQASGLATTLEINGDGAALPAGYDLATYRIVQEALTNALKHAGPASAIVRIDITHDHVTIDVSDDGVGRRAVNGSAGHGLIGIRERVSLYGGTVEAGPYPAGGWRVAATLPFEAGAVR